MKYIIPRAFLNLSHDLFSSLPCRNLYSCTVTALSLVLWASFIAPRTGEGAASGPANGRGRAGYMARLRRHHLDRRATKLHRRCTQTFRHRSIPQRHDGVPFPLIPPPPSLSYTNKDTSMQPAVLLVCVQPSGLRTRLCSACRQLQPECPFCAR